MGHYVYKYVLNDEILYIGKNDTDLHSRIASHGKPGDNIPRAGWEELRKAEIYYLKLANATMCDVIESELIRRYKPKYNKAVLSTEWCGLPFAEPEWTKYIPPEPNRKTRSRPDKNARMARHITEIEQIIRHYEKIEPILQDLQAKFISKCQKPIAHSLSETALENKDSGCSVYMGALAKEQIDALDAAKHLTLYALDGSFYAWNLQYYIRRLKTEKNEPAQCYVETWLSQKMMLTEIETAFCNIRCMRNYFRELHNGNLKARLDCCHCTKECKQREWAADIQ